MNKRITNFAMGATFILVVVMAFLFSSCKPKHKVKVYNFPNFVNWNLSLRPEASEDERKQAIAIVSDSILDLKYTPPPVTGRGEKDSTGQGSMTDAQREAQKKLYSKVDSLKIFTCPCDPNLVNFTANLIVIDSSGDAVVLPPRNPTPKLVIPGTTVGRNDTLGHLSGTIDEQSVKKGVRFGGFPKDPSDKVILGVLDTGLDSTLFDPAIQGLIWQDATPANTLYNFLPGEDASKLVDNNPSKHGSAATAIALKEITAKQSPKIMVLKVLDGHGHGTVFSVTCGMSYARQHNASVINASLGYYGKEDSIFRKYFTKEYQTTVLVAAAGNDTIKPHEPGMLCHQPVKSSNELNGSHMFYPACFTELNKDLISVTGMTGTKAGMYPCYYQNYSDKFVTLGVLKTDKECCTMNVPFLTYPVEGSSFVAPVVSGKLANYMIKDGFKPTTKLYLQGIGVNNAAPLTGNATTPATVKYTVDGQYIPN